MNLTYQSLELYNRLVVEDILEKNIKFVLRMQEKISRIGSVTG